jgi:hypothetical protein
MISRFLYLVVAISVAASSPASPRSSVVAKFGGECTGVSFQPSAPLQRLIEHAKQRTRDPMAGSCCNDAFLFDLNHDGRYEYFVRLSCGGTGNCLWGIFSARPARLRGTFTAWFFYIHRATASWNALTTYTREGGDQGVIATLRNRRGTYVQTSERTEHGYYGNWQPFLKRMGVPKCS